jgi:hypothetical protein
MSTDGVLNSTQLLYLGSFLYNETLLVTDDVPSKSYGFDDGSDIAWTVCRFLPLKDIHPVDYDGGDAS